MGTDEKLEFPDVFKDYMGIFDTFERHTCVFERWCAGCLLDTIYVNSKP